MFRTAQRRKARQNIVSVKPHLNATPHQLTVRPAISLQTLKTLATSPNPSIAASATSLIVQRFAALPDASKLLANDANSGDEARSRQALTAIKFLRDWPSGPMFSDVVSIPDSPAMSPCLEAMPGDREGGLTRTPESLPDLFAVDGELVGAEMDRMDGLIVPSREHPVAGWTNVPRERPPRTENLEELERRRRRREAMVLHEGSGRVNEDDIFRPRR